MDALLSVKALLRKQLVELKDRGADSSVLDPIYDEYQRASSLLKSRPEPGSPLSALIARKSELKEAVRLAQQESRSESFVSAVYAEYMDVRNSMGAHQLDRTNSGLLPLIVANVEADGAVSSKMAASFESPVATADTTSSSRLAFAVAAPRLPPALDRAVRSRALLDARKRELKALLRSHSEHPPASLSAAEAAADEARMQALYHEYVVIRGELEAMAVGGDGDEALDAGAESAAAILVSSASDGALLVAPEKAAASTVAFAESPRAELSPPPMSGPAEASGPPAAGGGGGGVKDGGSDASGTALTMQYLPDGALRLSSGLATASPCDVVFVDGRVSHAMVDGNRLEVERGDSLLAWAERHGLVVVALLGPRTGGALMGDSTGSMANEFEPLPLSLSMSGLALRATAVILGGRLYSLRVGGDSLLGGESASTRLFRADARVSGLGASAWSDAVLEVSGDRPAAVARYESRGVTCTNEFALRECAMSSFPADQARAYGLHTDDVPRAVLLQHLQASVSHVLVFKSVREATELLASVTASLAAADARASLAQAARREAANTAALAAKAAALAGDLGADETDGDATVPGLAPSCQVCGTTSARLRRLACSHGHLCVGCSQLKQVTCVRCERERRAALRSKPKECHICHLSPSLLYDLKCGHGRVCRGCRDLPQVTCGTCVQARKERAAALTWVCQACSSKGPRLERLACEHGVLCSGCRALPQIKCVVCERERKEKIAALERVCQVCRSPGALRLSLLVCMHGFVCRGCEGIVQAVCTVCRQPAKPAA